MTYLVRRQTTTESKGTENPSRKLIRRQWISKFQYSAKLKKELPPPKFPSMKTLMGSLGSYRNDNGKQRNKSTFKGSNWIKIYCEISIVVKSAKFKRIVVKLTKPFLRLLPWFEAPTHSSLVSSPRFPCSFSAWCPQHPSFSKNNSVLQLNRKLKQLITVK